MSPDDWIVIPGWEKFQHYKTRNPPWIKAYTALLRKPEYLDLSYHRRGLLHGIWLLYACRNGRVRVRDIHKALSSWNAGDASVAHLEALNHAGFIQFCASTPLFSIYTDTRARPTKQARTRQAAVNWIRNGAALEIPPEHLAEAIADEFKIADDPSLLADLVALVQEQQR